MKGENHNHLKPESIGALRVDYGGLGIWSFQNFTVKEQIVPEKVAQEQKISQKKLNLPTC